MATTEQSTTPYNNGGGVVSVGGGLSCVVKSCPDNTTSTPTPIPCTYTCIYLDSTLSPPPHPSPLSQQSSSHMAPFLIAAVCILGLSFLLLSTCTIILRLRFSHRRNRNRHRLNSLSSSSTSLPPDPSFVDHPIWHISTVGLSPSLINSISTFKYKSVDNLLSDGSDCSVCLTEFQDGDDLRLLPKCCHAFHVTCVDTWLRSHTTCPVCRSPVINPHHVNNNDYFNHNNNVDESGGSGGGSGGEEEEEVVVVEGMIRVRAMSDLGENRRFRRESEVEEMRRSASFNVLGSGNYGSSSVTVVVEKEEERERKEGKEVKRGASMVGMKRSVSASSSKFFSSFRRSKSHASILPL